MAVITISRQYGSGGDQIAGRVCEMLGYQYFDKRLMAQLAAEMGLSEEQVVDYSSDDYKVRSFLERLPGRRGPRVIAEARVWTGSGTREIQQLDEVYAIDLVKSTIQAAYTHGNVVIIGRGGQVILKDKPDVLHVRIEASLEAQSQRIQERDKVSLAEAREIALNHDRAAADYLKRFYHIDWKDSQLYDLVINTSKLGPEAAAHLIVNAVSYLPQAEVVEQTEA